MSDHPVEYHEPSRALGTNEADLYPPLDPAGYEPEEPKGPGLERYVAAVLRFKWIILLVTFLGAAAGVLLARMVPPQYQTSATLWIEARPRQSQSDVQPIRSAELLTSYAWVELVKANAVLEAVVRERRLYLNVSTPGGETATSTLTVGDDFTPGGYRLTISPDGRQYALSRTRDEEVIERGQVGRPIGRTVGLQWQPPAGSLQPGQVIDFGVSAIRPVTERLAANLIVRPDREVNFLNISLTGTDPEETAATVNAVKDHYIRVAADLKRARLSQLSTILQEQLQVAERNLHDAEVALQDFKVTTITLPSDRGSPLAPGLQLTQDPVFDNYFQMKIEQEQLQRDREVIARVLDSAQNGPLSVFALESIESLSRSPSLQASLAALTERRANVRALQERYTDQAGPVVEAQAAVDNLERNIIPAQARALLAELNERDRELASLIGSASGELRSIPPRAIEEARLQRRVEIASTLYTDLQRRTEEARLAAVSTIPDVRSLDDAAPPQWPSNGDAHIKLILMAVVGSFGLAVGGALLLDRFDPKVRYPDQVTGGMGLSILGAVPFVRNSTAAHVPEEANHAIEAFREIRMNTMYAFRGTGNLAVAISSAEAGDGKSFVASNLALSFAQQGHRTLLIDGDIRRGRLHHFLNVKRTPGLSDVLAQRATLDEVVQTTSVPLVSLVGSGTRMHIGPELLGSAAMVTHLRELRRRFDVVVIDTPPLGAGVDPYILSALTGNLLMVVRTGNTNRAFAEAKLKLFDRLPVTILGAILNGIPANQRMYRYYSYLPSYGAQEETPVEVGGAIVNAG